MMISEKCVQKKQQTEKITKNNKHTRHIEFGGNVQLYFIHHFNQK